MKSCRVGVIVVIGLAFFLEILFAHNLHSTIIRAQPHDRHNYYNHERNRVKKSGNTYVQQQQPQTHRQHPFIAEASPPELLSSPSSASSSYHNRDKKPNIILILTDDQDVELGSLNFMPRTLRLIRDAGAEFRHAYASTPMCCPSRSSLLTGMYAHNHMVFTNNDNCSSPTWQATHETRSFATYLSNAGYRTGYFGKYLNKYNGSYIPPGWREWGGLIMNSKYYNYSINMNGKRIKHGFDYEKDYYPDLIANDSIAFLRQSKQQNQRKPIMLTMSFPSPHGTEDSAPQYSHLFVNVTTHHTPSYDLAPNPDKQWILRVTDPMKPIHKKFTDILMTKRLQTLQSVDIAVERVYNELKALGELENTYIIYTSDHGYHLGQFGLIKGKGFPFEFDVRVPFLVRGPGIQPATIVDEIVMNIDLAPTFLDMGGVSPLPNQMDGRSILPLLLHRHKNTRHLWPDTFLIESSGRRETPEQIAEAKARLQAERISMKLVNSTIVDDTLKSFPMDISHEEDDDEADDDEDEVSEFDNDMQNDQYDNDLPFGSYQTKMMRLNSECSNPALLKDCVPNQQWKCINEDGRWRKHKCKFHLQVQAEVSKMPRPRETHSRNCACFTPDGVVYKKIKSEGKRIRKRNQSPDLLKKRRKRHVLEENSFELYENGASSTLIHLLNLTISLEDYRNELINEIAHQSHSIRKREIATADPIMNKIHDFQKLLDDLESEIKDISKSNKTKCFIESFYDKVNCTKGEIHDTNREGLVGVEEKSRKKSKEHIDLLIRILKDKIGDLKSIKKHLRLNRINNADTGYDTDDEDIDDNAKGNNLYENKENNSTKMEENLYLSNATSETDFNNSSVGGSSLETSTVVITNEIKETFEPHRKFESQGPQECLCEADADGSRLPAEKELAKEARRKLKEERQKRKQRKRNKKARLEKECLSEKMNCFSHDNDHWRTAPFWNDDPFCFCMNANNNTYSCVRTINSTHDFLYCEFTTGLITFYNLRIDPFETQNRASSLTLEERSHLHDTLNHLKGCRGKGCTIKRQSQNNDIPFQTSSAKRRYQGIPSAYGGHLSKRRKLSKWAQHQQQHNHHQNNSGGNMNRKLWQPHQHRIRYNSKHHNLNNPLEHQDSLTPRVHHTPTKRKNNNNHNIRSQLWSDKDLPF
ncbi:SULF1 family protein [Megaselia abdita]